MSRTEWLNQICDDIKKQIEQYAMDNRISFEEAALRVYLAVDGQIIEPIDSKDLNFKIPRSN